MGASIPQMPWPTGLPSIYSRNAGGRSTVSGNATCSPVDSAVLQQSSDPKALLRIADHFYWLSNGPAAAPIYARAEKLFAAEGDSRNELYAKVGRLRSQAETMSFLDLSRFLNEQLQTPIVQYD